MSVPLDITLISQLLNEQRTTGDLNALTKPGFFFVLWPTNTPNNRTDSCHVINLVNYNGGYTLAFQIYINDNMSDKTIWYRKHSSGWTEWERFATASDLPNSTTNNPSQGE